MVVCPGRIGQRANGPASSLPSPVFWSAICGQSCPTCRHGLLRCEPGLFLEPNSPQHTLSTSHSGLEYHVHSLRPRKPSSAFPALREHGIFLNGTFDRGLLRAAANAMVSTRASKRAEGHGGHCLVTAADTNMQMSTEHPVGGIFMEVENAGRGKNKTLENSVQMWWHWHPQLGCLRTLGYTSNAKTLLGPGETAVKEPGCGAKWLQCWVSDRCVHHPCTQVREQSKSSIFNCLGVKREKTQIEKMLLSPLERTVAGKGPCTQRATQRKREIRKAWVIGKLWKDCQDFHERYIKKKIMRIFKIHS